MKACSWDCFLFLPGRMANAPNSEDRVLTQESQRLMDRRQTDRQTSIVFGHCSGLIGLSSSSGGEDNEGFLWIDLRR
jgi:hypothetical protein